MPLMAKKKTPGTVPTPATIAPADLASNVGAAIRRLRSAQGLTLSEVAERAKISAAMLSRLETGAVSPSLETVAAVAAALGADLPTLFRGLGVQQSERERLRLAVACDTNRLDRWMRTETILDRNGRDVLALTRLEQFLHPTRDTQASRFIDLAAISGTKEAIGGEPVSRALVAVVTQHLSRTLDENLAIRGDTAFHPG